MGSSEDIMRKINQGLRETSKKTFIDDPLKAIPKKSVKEKESMDEKKDTLSKESEKPTEEKENVDKSENSPKNETEKSVKQEPMNRESVIEQNEQIDVVETTPNRAKKEQQETVETKEVQESKQKDNQPQHPEPRVEYPDETSMFSELSALDKLMFKDVFVDGDSGVVYNSDYAKSTVKNLSKGIIQQVIKDLKDKYNNAIVFMGESKFIISEANAVFTSPTSLMRYLLLNQIDDENLALQLARQLFLEKHPDGEKADFKHTSVRTDERDIYALLLSSKAKPEKDLSEKIEELTRTIEYIGETNTTSLRKILNQTDDSYELLNGINIASSLLVLERLGLTEGNLPRNIESVRGFATQDNIVKLSDQLGNDIASDVLDRKRTIARDERMRGNSRSSYTGEPPRAIKRTQVNRNPSTSRDY